MAIEPSKSFFTPEHVSFPRPSPLKLTRAGPFVGFGFGFGFGFDVDFGFGVAEGLIGAIGLGAGLVEGSACPVSRTGSGFSFSLVSVDVVLVEVALSSPDRT